MYVKRNEYESPAVRGDYTPNTSMLGRWKESYLTTRRLSGLYTLHLKAIREINCSNL